MSLKEEGVGEEKSPGSQISWLTSLSARKGEIPGALHRGHPALLRALSPVSHIFQRIHRIMGQECTHPKSCEIMVSLVLAKFIHISQFILVQAVPRMLMANSQLRLVSHCHKRYSYFKILVASNGGSLVLAFWFYLCAYHGFGSSICNPLWLKEQSRTSASQ